MIDCVAIKTKDGTIWSMPRPARHPHLIDRIANRTGAPVRGETQGFLTDAGHFLDRESALWHVEALGQLEGFFVGCGVEHPDHGRGHVDKISLAGKSMIVKFLRASVLTTPERLSRCLIGGPLTSEDLWPTPSVVAAHGE